MEIFRLNTFIYLMDIVVFFFFLFSTFIYILLQVLSFYAIREYNSRYKFISSETIPEKFVKPISIIVPAYNEEDVIISSVKSILDINHPEFEVIVVNDGSKDNTLEKLLTEFHLEKMDFIPEYTYPCEKITGIYFSDTESKLIVIDKMNGGKADAQNAGGNLSRYPFIAAVDSDSLLERDSIQKLMSNFSASPDYIAAGGIIRLSNGCRVEKSRVKEISMPSGLLEQIQVVEYFRAFLFGRMGWSKLNVLLIISGAFGAYRQDILTKVKGWDKNAIGEDMDLVVRIHKYMIKNRIKKRLAFIPDPICWTQAPSDYAGLSGQRDRWQRGLMEVLVRNISMFFNPAYGRIGMIGYPYFFIFEMLGSILEFISVPVIIISFTLRIVNLPFFLVLISASIVWGVCVSLGSILLEEISYMKYKSKGDIIKLMLAAFYENFGFRQLHAFWRFKGTLKFIFRIRSGWGSIERRDFQ